MVDKLAAFPHRMNHLAAVAVSQSGSLHFYYFIVTVVASDHQLRSFISSFPPPPSTFEKPQQSPLRVLVQVLAKVSPAELGSSVSRELRVKCEILPGGREGAI